jgi:hypothetical protein
MKKWLESSHVLFNESTLIVIEHLNRYREYRIVSSVPGKFLQQTPMAVMHRERSTGKMEPWYCPGEE